MQNNRVTIPSRQFPATLILPYSIWFNNLDTFKQAMNTIYRILQITRLKDWLSLHYMYTIARYKYSRIHSTLPQQKHVSKQCIDFPAPHIQVQNIRSFAPFDQLKFAFLTEVSRFVGLLYSMAPAVYLTIFPHCQPFAVSVSARQPVISTHTPHRRAFRVLWFSSWLTLPPSSRISVPFDVPRRKKHAVTTRLIIFIL